MKRAVCIYPMGLPTVTVQLMIVLSYFLAVLASWGCRFVEIDSFHFRGYYPENLESSSDPFAYDESLHRHLASNIGLGLLSFEAGAKGCTAWSQNNASLLLGGAWRVASASALAGNIFIGLSMFLSFCLTCFQFSKAWRIGLSTTLLIGSLFEALTIVVFADDVCRGASCAFSVNAVLSVAASIMAFVSAVMVLDLSPPECKPYNGCESVRGRKGCER